MSVTAAAGFVAAGVAAGVKADGALDLALVATEDGTTVPTAGVFTENRMAGAPVQVTRDHLRTSAGQAAAVVLNSGNANAGTGEQGEADATTLCAGVAAELGCDPRAVLVCSTGLIGIPLPMASLQGALPSLAAARRKGGSTEAAQAILTTDTVRKEVVVEGEGFVVGGMAKGAAMLAPDMATMLAVLTTDAGVEPAVLEDVLAHGVDHSFNTLSVDGSTSTNDTVLLLASGRAGPADPRALALSVAEACSSLAEQMAGDAEGATKVVRITVTGAHSDGEASLAARTVADSALCKCSWYGADPYWGRIASELGASGARFDQRLVRISYGEILVADGGVAVAHEAEAVAAHMAGRHLQIDCDLGIGPGRASVLTNDLTHAYIDENMGTS